jgi:hypothetical protein
MNARSGRWAFRLTAVAFAWSSGLVAAALLAPFYGGTSRTGSGPAVSTSSTLVDVNGAGVLVVAAIPAILTVIVWIALHRRCSRGSSRAAGLARAAVFALAVLAVVGAASIGLLVLPVALLLGAAVSLTPSPEAGSPITPHSR